MNTQAHPLVGEVVDGRYRVDDFVARGGMATVYRATDLRLDRVVALKVMHASLAEDPDFVDKFVREARAAARLSHPAIVAVFDQGQSDGIVYLAMEYVHGYTLRDLINREGRLQPAAALAVMEPVLEALNAAHEAGFAHRDIKPENVLIAEDGRVKVADFGLARAFANTKSSVATQGVLIGTVAYLAPEQVEQGSADARSDVYSAGIVLYECVVGQVPYSGETPLSIAYQHVNGRVPVPSSIRPGIPPAVDELVAIATRTDPSSRYADAADFVHHLRMTRALLGNSDPASHTVVLDRNAATVAVGPWTTPAFGAQSDAVASAVPPPPDHLTVAVQDVPPPSPPIEPPAVELSDRARRPRRFRVLIALLVLVLLAALAGGGTYLWAKSQMVQVPALVGMTPAQASEQLRPNGLSLQVVGTDYSDSVPEGAILLTDPGAGAELRKGDTVRARTSAGPQTVAVPKVVGKSSDRAQTMLKALGLTSTSTEEFSTSVPSGRVISSKPAPGETIRVGTNVELVVSKGPPPVEVPSLIALDRDTAVARLQALGLRADVRNQLPVVMVGRVYSQSPGAGEVVPVGSTVTISLV